MNETNAGHKFAMLGRTLQFYLRPANQTRDSNYASMTFLSHSSRCIAEYSWPCNRCPSQSVFQRLEFAGMGVKK